MSRYKGAVEDKKLTEPVKMAILIDLMADPSLHDYLIAANDGCDGRYKQAIDYLKTRFDRPRELHQIYCNQLVDLPPVKANPQELSQLADTIFAAVAGLRRSGQATIDSIATSLATPALPSSIRLEWENKTEEDHGVPNVDQLITFIRKKATNAAQAQKPGSSPAPSRAPKEKKFQKSYVKQESKVHYTQSDSAGGAGEQASTPSKNRQAKTFNHGCKTSCTLCSNMHYAFQCNLFKEMSVQQRQAHVQTASLCSNCLRTGHRAQDCSSSFRCRLCKMKHNTMLHTDAAAAPVSVNHILHIKDEHPDAHEAQHKMMMTSLVVVTGPTGEQLTVRAMLDSGAETSILSKKCDGHPQFEACRLGQSIWHREPQADSH